MDVLVYSRFMKGVTTYTNDYIEDTWNRVKKQYTHYIYFPIFFYCLWTTPEYGYANTAGI